jgi:Ran GTPase-activating protein 1
MTDSTPVPLTLTPGGPREVVTEEKANEIITQWRSQLQTHRTKYPDLTPICDKIDLSDKSYTIEAAKIIANFLTSPSSDGESSSLASGIQIADLHDIIASRMEEEGLQVLKTLSDVFEESTLIEVDLSDNAMGSKGVTQCQTILGGKPSLNSLEKLSLCNNGLSEFSMSEIADLLTSNGAETCIAQNLSKIHFFNNMSGNEGCKAFQRIMDRCTDKLTDIRFSSTRARREGSSLIAKALADLGHNSKLQNVTSLDLADNSFGQSYDNVASALEHCVKLEYLNLKDCILTNDGMKKVCKALLKAKSPLKFLHLSGNEIDAQGAKYVAKLVKTLNATVEVFDVEENELKSFGIKRIVQELNSTTLKKVLLNENECGLIGATAVIESAAKMPNLEHIEFDRNNLSDDIVDQLVETFGERLVDMEDNFGEESEDEDEEEEEESEEEEEEEGDAKEPVDASVDALTAAMSSSGI